MQGSGDSKHFFFTIFGGEFWIDLKHHFIMFLFVIKKSILYRLTMSFTQTRERVIPSVHSTVFLVQLHVVFNNLSHLFSRYPGCMMQGFWCRTSLSGDPRKKPPVPEPYRFDSTKPVVSTVKSVWSRFWTQQLIRS